MHRLLLLTSVGFVFACAVAEGVPARPLYEPPAVPKAPVRVGVDLSGTAWLGKYNAINRIFFFEADGTLSYRSATAKGKLFKNRGSWKLDGKVLTFEHFINPQQKMMQFRGIVKDANTIVGEATYPLLNGKQAVQTLQRMTP